MRKFLYTVGLATVILLNAAVVKASNDVYYTNLNHLEMTEQQYNNLLNQGFTEEQIYRMDEDEFLENKDVEANLISEEKKYIKMHTTLINGIKYTTSTVLSELQYQEALLQAQQPTYSPNVSGSYYDGDYWDAMFEIVTRIANINDDVFRFKMDVYWDTMPTDKYYDIMGMGFDVNKVHIGTDIFFRQDWQTYSNVFDHSIDCYTKDESTGGSVIFELPDVSTSSLKNMSQYMYYYVYKNTGVGTLYNIQAVGSYAHADTYYNPSPLVTNGLYSNFTTNIAGIDIDAPYRSHYDIIAPVVASFVGTW